MIPTHIVLYLKRLVNQGSTTCENQKNIKILLLELSIEVYSQPELLLNKLDI